MIIKCISYKSKNFSNIVRYVMAGHKLEPAANKAKPLYVPGVRLSAQDRKFLEMERDDALLMHELKEQGGDVQKFIAGLMAQAAERALLNGNGEKHNQGSLQPVIFRHNLRSRSSLSGFIKEFSDNEKLRLHSRSNNVTAFHNILSFSKSDSKNLSEEILKDIVQKYISIRGPDSIFLGAVHQDKAHVHIHLIQSGVRYCTGVSNRVTRQQFQEIKVAMQEYLEKYPQLTDQPDFKGKHLKQKSMEQSKNIKTNERSSVRNDFIRLLETTLAKSSSSMDFIDRLHEMGHEAYYRNGNLQGIKQNGDNKFRLSSAGLDQKLQMLDMMKEAEERELKELRELRSPSQSRSKELILKEPAVQVRTSEEILDKYEAQAMEERTSLEGQGRMGERDMEAATNGAAEHSEDEREDEPEFDDDMDTYWEPGELEDDIDFGPGADDDLER